VAIVAGAPLDLAVRIGAAMTCLQLGIGTLNDVVDAPADMGRKPGKPIPAGLVGLAAARAAAIVLFGAGLALAASVSAGLGVLSLVVVGIGLAYDLRLKGTAWSWLPFAVGIPILPVFGWYGATGGLPVAFAVLVPAAVAAGAALALANGLVDIERDEAAGRTSAAARIGPDRTVAVIAGLFASIALLAVGTAVAVGVDGLELVALIVAGIAPTAAAIASRGRSAGGREWAWRIEAVAVAALGLLWVRAVLA
jgi:4-hydroxybenzoate polyprenyltransferase